ncbi:MAG: hypothetical protein EOP10_01605 [Proteobacteria bacterium]|nr:MAG: hypothetical protein EOP10_01605 [Pseudomonadota bacterium]
MATPLRKLKGAKNVLPGTKVIAFHPKALRTHQVGVHHITTPTEPHGVFNDRFAATDHIIDSISEKEDLEFVHRGRGIVTAFICNFERRIILPEVSQSRI